MADVFISHASLDRSLADSFVALLEGGVGLRPLQIFCTSLEGQGVKPGANFKDFIGEQLQGTQVVIALLSENFYASAFCMCELGATWIQAKRFLPILVPPLGFSDLKAVLEGVQCLKLDNPSDLDTLRDTISGIVSDSLGTPRWNKRRNDFLEGLPEILANIEKPSTVRRVELDKLNQEKEEYKKAYEKLDDDAKTLRSTIEKLSGLNSHEDAAAVVLDAMPENEQFEKLIEVAHTELKRLPKPVQDTAFHWIRNKIFLPDQELFDPTEKAEEDGFLEMTQGGFTLREDHPKIERVMSALTNLASFVDGCSPEFQQNYEKREDSLLDVRTRPFWEDWLIH